MDSEWISTCVLSEAHVHRGLSCFQDAMFIVYLDEFGHVGPFLSKDHPQYSENPVFGLAGFLLPMKQVRSFASWFYQSKCRLLDFEIVRSGKHPSVWEKKGAALYTLKNIQRYRELRFFTNRFFNQIQHLNGKIIYVGMQKQAAVEEHKPKRLYLATFRETLNRLNGYFEDRPEPADFILVMDQHQDRDVLLTAASQAMFRKQQRHCRLLEPPFEVESHRYQTLQAADWICGLIGRIAPFWILPEEYPELEPVEHYFGNRLRNLCIRSGIRGDKRLHHSRLITGPS